MKKKSRYKFDKGAAEKAMDRSKAEIEATTRGTPAGYKTPKFRTRRAK